MNYFIYKIDDYEESVRLGDEPSPWNSADTYTEALRICREELRSQGMKPEQWVTVFYIEEA